MNLMLISNSTNAGEKYLGWCKDYINDFCKEHNVKKALFIPYAGVNINSESLKKSFDAYEEKVSNVFKTFNVSIKSVHRSNQPIKAVIEADAIIVGGGNTFALIDTLQKSGLMNAIREKVKNGTPYIGWSAGSNITCPTMMTTNDMPIIQPDSFDCLNLIPFQINPHYLDKNPEGHGGETREQRILEFLVLNRKMYVAGLRESCYLLLIDGKLTLHGPHSLRLFKYGEPIRELNQKDDFNFLLK
ncbi:MAG: dipeptidase PepE [Bacteroidales bacterium]